MSRCPVCRGRMVSAGQQRTLNTVTKAVTVLRYWQCQVCKKIVGRKT